jgi:proteasome accessory factor C
MTVADLAKVIGCKPAELLDDLSRRVLLCGVPPYLPNDYIDVHIEGERVSIRFAEHFKRPVRFTMQEALALRTVLSTLTGAEGPKKLLAKLDHLLSAETKKKVASVRGRIGFMDHPLTVLQQVEDALRSRREIEVEYYTASRDAMTERTLRPYGTVFHQGHWYVVAYCLGRRRELPFRVDRIKAIRVLDRAYEIPKGFDISRYEREEMYLPVRGDKDVRIRFDAHLARWIREEVPRGSISELDDGGIVLHLSTAHFEWLIRWLLPFGCHAEVLAPPSLRQRMLDVSRETLAAYGAS